MEEQGIPEVSRIDFDSMNMPVGAKLQVLTHRGRTPTQHISTFIGMENNEYLLLRLPRVQGNAMTFYDGEKITVRVFSGTMICSFDSSVIQTFYHPLNCLCISYPENIRVNKIRREMRVKVDIDAKVNLPDQSVVETRLVNLSATGCQIRVGREIGHVDDQLLLNFNIPLFGEEHGSDISLNAKIRNILDDSDPNGQRLLIGVEFVSVDPTTQLIVRHYVYEGLVDRRQSLA
ncbi:flagellar brake protein [Methylobacillus arboreus]|uniref:flagellar brake protein n=1 Tax=Methylobacillus arboreus TaxID=755170 RepID=UPI001E34026C|nr:flagellar brake protein [Methylobacillus arboreus]MCB5191667.1 flagellar brake protein [Methylobacillus arboreus]